MKVFCMACGRDDFPETEQYGASATARDHLRIFHPDEFFTVETAPDGLVIYPSPGCNSNPPENGSEVQQYDGEPS